MIKNSSIALISCDHGLGHIRRSFLRALQFLQNNNTVTVLASEEGALRIKDVMPSSAGIFSINLRTNTRPELFRKSVDDITSWLDSLPDLSSYDYIICDNLPEILLVRADARLSAQFFWHNILPNSNYEYYRLCEDLLAKHSPFIYGYKLFTMPEIINRRNYIPTELLYSPDLLRLRNGPITFEKDSLLVSGGTTSAVKNRLKSLVDNFVQHGPGSYKEVRVDSSLMPSHAPPWIKKADFSPEMYMRLRSAICRPGLGTVSELICAKVPMFLLHEPENRELAYNTKVLIDSNLGERFGSFEQVFALQPEIMH